MLQGLQERIDAGGRLTPDEALHVYRHAPTYWLGRMADRVRRRKHPEGVVSYIIDRNVNYTNVCVARCNFCAFYRPVGSGEGYVLGFDEIFRKIDETLALGGGQLLLQGGHNPDLPIAVVRRSVPRGEGALSRFPLHALSPPEVLHLSRTSRLAVPEVIERLIAAGLDSIPGGGAEILVDRVRKLLNCYGKASADEWLDVMRHAHRAGLRTTATMMYGTVETDEERLEHMLRLRALQDETGGFTAFIAWSYQPEHTERGGTEATGVEYLRTLALVAARARQLRQPPGVVGDAGRQGGAVEPGVRRQRHGQRDDRGERRARGRRRATAWTKSRSSATSRTPASSPSAATCTTTSSASRCSASARCRARWNSPRRATPATRRCPPNSRTIPPAAPPASGSARQPPASPVGMIRLPGGVGLPIDAAAHQERLGRRRGRANHGGGSRESGATSAPLRRAGSRESRSRPGGVCCRASSTRTCTSSCPGCAAACRRPTASPPGSRSSSRRGARPSGSSDPAVTRGGARQRRGRPARPAPWRSATSATRSRSVEPIARGRPARARLPRTARLQGTRRPRSSSSRRPRATPRARQRRAVTMAPHAPYSVSPELFQRDPGGASDALGRPDHQRPPWRVAGGGRAAGARHGRVARMLQFVGAWREDWTAPGLGPGGVPRSPRRDRRAHARRARRAVRRGRAWRACAARGATLVTCPRSNQWVGVGAPPIARFYRSGVAGRRRHRQPGERGRPEPVQRAEGDALARAGACRRAGCSRAPRSSARGRSAWSTTSGRLAPGKRAEVVAVQVPRRG